MPIISSFFLFPNYKEVDKMSLERVFETLLSLGLSQTDARVYIFLALKGPEKTLTIIKNLNISKQQIYQSLKHLKNEGIINSDPERKNSCSALPFDEALKSLILKGKEQTTEMQKTLISTWKTLMKKNSHI
jgi:sugar-specific transcriptional regulator TrmB